MPKVKDIEAAQDYPQLQKLKARNKRNGVKMERAVENMVNDLAGQVEYLSGQVLLLRKALKEVFRILTPSQKEEYDRIKKKLDNELNEENHERQQD